MEKLRQIILQNRYSVLISTLVIYLAVLVIEGALTGREARVIDFDNPFFDLNLDMEQLRERREQEERAERELRA